MTKAILTYIMMAVLLSVQSAGAYSDSHKASRSSSKSYGNSSRTTGSKQGSAKTYSNRSQGGGSKYGNSSASASAAPEKRKNEKRYGNSSGSEAASRTETKSSSSFGHAAEKSLAKVNSKEAHARYESERSRFKTQQSGDADSRRYANSSTFDRRTYRPDTYYERRNVFYDRHRYAAPEYTYRSYPSFGMWDAVFLWFMLDNISQPHYARMYHNHQNDPGFQQWRQEANKLSQDNQDLKKKLDTMDKEVAKLKGEPVDEKYLPEGHDPDIMMDKKALDALPGEKPAAKSGHGFLTFVLAAGALLLIGYILYRIMKARSAAAAKQKYKLD